MRYHFSVKSFLVRCSEDELAQIDAAAKKAGRSRNSWVLNSLISPGPPEPISDIADTRHEKVAEAMSEIQRKCPHTVGRSPQGRCFACGHVR